MEYLDQKKNSGLLLFVDFEKAFDSLEWDFIDNSLKSFNFRLENQPLFGN